MNQRNLAMMLGGAGLAAGVAAAGTGRGVLGLVAGGLAAGAGLSSLAAAPDTSPTASPTASGSAAVPAGADGEVAGLRAELEQSRAEASLLREAAEHHKRELAAAESRLAELTGQLAAAQATGRQPDAPELEAHPELAPSPDGAAGGTRLTDPRTGLFTEAYFRVALDSRIASARRHLRPVAVALIDVVEGTGTATGERADPGTVAGSIRETLRDSDTASRLADGVYGLILEDTPENGAVWTVERVRRNIVNRHGTHTLWAGVACYPAHAFSTEELLEQARAALAAAREWQQDRIEVAIAEG